MFSLQNWIALYIHRHIQYRYNEMFHSATSVSIKVLETDIPHSNLIDSQRIHNSIIEVSSVWWYWVTAAAPNLWICLLYNATLHIYFIQSILLLLNWCISPVRSPAINWAPRVDKSCINCTLYNCTAPLEYHSKSSTTVQQYNSTTNCTTVQLYSITTVPQQKQYNYTTVL